MKTMDAPCGLQSCNVLWIHLLILLLCTLLFFLNLFTLGSLAPFPGQMS